MQTILLAYDDSPQAQKAFEQALDVAKRYEAKLLVLSVVRLPDPPEDLETEALIESGRSHFHKLHKQLKQRLDEAGIPADFVVAAGHPAEQILYHAEKHAVALIMVGRRGHSSLARWLMGSVTRQVMDHATCSVLVVH